MDKPCEVSNRSTSCLTTAASATDRSEVLTDNQSNQLSLCAGYHGSRRHDNCSLNSLIFLQNSELCSLNVYMKKSLVVTDSKPSEVTFLRQRICGKMSYYKGLKTSRGG